MLTSSGFSCDVCGKYILGLTEQDMVYEVKITGIDQILHYCYKCDNILHESVEKHDYKLLPEGRLKKVFQDAETQQERVEQEQEGK